MSKKTHRRLETNLPLDPGDMPSLEAEFDRAYREVSIEAVERYTEGRPRPLEISVGLGALGTFRLKVAAPPESETGEGSLGLLFGTTGSALRPGSRLRGLYLQGEIVETGQPVRLVRMPEAEFHLLPLDLPETDLWPQRVGDDEG